MRSFSAVASNPKVIWSIFAACVVTYCAHLVAAGRLSYDAVALVIAVSPLLVWLLLVQPYVLPYGLYAFLVPIGTVFTFGHLGTLARILGLISGVVLLLYALRMKHFNAFPRTVYLLGLFATWAVASIMWAIDPGVATTGALTIVQLVLFYIVVAIAPITRKDFRIVMFSVVAGGVMAGIYGAYTFYKEHDMIAAQDQMQRLQIQVGDNAIDTNHYANSLLFPCVALLVWMLHERRLWMKALCAAGIATMLAGIYYSGSRETLVALVAVLGYLLLAAPKYRLQVGVIVGMLVAAVPALPMIAYRFSNAISTGGAGRTSIWRTQLLAARDHWLFGAGASNSPFAYNEVYLKVFQAYTAGWGRVAHNIYLETAVDFGIVGFVLLVAAFVVQFRLSSGIRPDDELYDYKLMIQGGMVALGVASLFIDMTVEKYMWLLLATGAQLYALRRDRVQAGPVAMKAAVDGRPFVPATARALQEHTEATNPI